MSANVVDRINNVVQLFPESYKSLNEEQLTQVLTSLKIDDYKAQILDDKKKSNFNIEQRISLWLANKSPNSKRMYRLYLNYFINHIAEKSILDIDAFELDKFNMHILNHFSTSKAKLIFCTISSFYSDLVRWGDLDRNPCKGSKSHKFFYKEESMKYLPSDEDIQYLELYFDKKNAAHNKMRLAIHIMKNYGVRRDFFKNSITYNKGILTGFSKGKEYRVSIVNDQYLQKNIDLLNKLNYNTIASNIAKAVDKLWLDGIISRKFTCHDFRHLFAIREYTKDKDIHRVCGLLNHSTIEMTKKYLKGLKVAYESRGLG